MEQYLTQMLDTVIKSIPNLLTALVIFLLSLYLARLTGIILLIQKPFREGDTITVTDYDGIVIAIDLRTTEIKTFDGRIVILPNADLLSHAIVNYTRADRRRVDLPISVAYSSDPEQVRG